MSENDVTLNGILFTSGPSDGTKLGLTPSTIDAGARVNLFPLLRAMVAVAAAIGGYGVTSSTSITPGTGSKGPFTTAPAATVYAVDTLVWAFSRSDPTKEIIGPVVSHAGGILQMTGVYASGAGAVTDWIIVPYNRAPLPADAAGYLKNDGVGGLSYGAITELASSLAFTGVISPTQLAANTDNYAPTGGGTATTWRLSTDASRNLTGMTGGATGVVRLLENVGANDLVLKHDATSTAANRFYCPNSTDYTLKANESVWCVYDATSSRWRVIAKAPTTSAGWEFVETQTASTSSTIDLGVANLAAGYDYVIKCIEVKCSGDQAAGFPALRFGTGGSPTYQTSGYTSQQFTSGGGGGTDQKSERDNITSGVALGPNGAATVDYLGGASAGETWDGEIQISAPANSTIHKVSARLNYLTSSGGKQITLSTGWRTTAEVLTALRLLPSSGTFESGTFVLMRRKIAA